VREYDDDILMVKEYKAHSDEDFNSYVSINVEP